MTYDEAVDAAPGQFIELARAALAELPPRMPVAPPAAGSRAAWERVDPDCYRVHRNGRTVGWVDVVGALFVVLRGERYDRAVEVCQVLDFDRAIAALTPSGAHASRGTAA